MNPGIAKAIWNEFSTKICTKCMGVFPATREYFHKNLHGAYGLTKTCKQCSKKYHSKRYLSKRDEILEKCRVYRLENREFTLESSRKSYLKHRESKLNYGKEYRNKNKDKELARRRKYYNTERGRELINFSAKIWTAWRRKTSKTLKKDFTLMDWNNCLNYFNNKCVYCGVSTDKLAIDHLIPISNFGETIKTNIVPSCKSCNSSKKNHEFESWYTKQQFYDEDRKQNILKFISIGVD